MARLILTVPILLALSACAASAQTATTASTPSTLSGQVLASQLIGATVYSPQGDSIGEVNDLLVSASTGQAGTAIIGVGGFLGIGEKDVAIELSRLRVEKTGSSNTAWRVVLDATKDQLKAAPAFDKSKQKLAQ